MRDFTIWPAKGLEWSSGTLFLSNHSHIPPDLIHFGESHVPPDWGGYHKAARQYGHTKQSIEVSHGYKYKVVVELYVRGLSVVGHE